MKQIIKKITASVLTASLAFGMAVSGSVGTAKAQSIADKALSAPAEWTAAYTEEDPRTGNTRFYFDGGDPAAQSQYAYSASVYIPKAVMKAKKDSAAVVQIYSDMNLHSEGEEDNYMGYIPFRYLVQLVNDPNDGFFLSVIDMAEDREMTDPAEYADIAALSEAGDFYKVDIKNNPNQDALHVEKGDGEEDLVPLSEVEGAVNFGINLQINAYQNDPISSIIYVDDISIKADGTEVVSESDLATDGRYYDYVLNDKDETVVEKPALVDLNISLLKLAKSSANIKVGKKVSIKATAPGNAKITYKSSNKKVATVTAKGVVKGKKAGTAKITVSANGVSKTFKVKVKK